MTYSDGPVLWVFAGTQGLFSLVRSTRMETRKVAGAAVHNLLLAPETQVAATMAGGLAVLKVGVRVMLLLDQGQVVVVDGEV